MTLDKPSVLLTGGAGYIGSHTYVALTEAGYRPVILDDFSNSHPVVLDRLAHLTGQRVLCERGDVLQTGMVAEVLKRYHCVAAVHFAGLKAVGESVQQPLRYYHTNVSGLLSLLQAMDSVDCRSVVFSSSATVYGDPASVPIKENFPCAPESPYARTKLACEDMLNSLAASNPAWRIGILRYFNPVGAHASGLIGEDPHGVPNNLMPYVTQVAVGMRDKLRVFGSDYPTPDGTGVRDYLHVTDLSEGHVAALRALIAKNQSFTVNLGTGEGISVLGVLSAFGRASGRPVPFEFVPRRAGDVAQYFADVSQAQALLGWRATRTIEDMCRDSWHWQQKNPDGYRTSMSSMQPASSHRNQEPAMPLQPTVAGTA
ncbi:UDP-glucose 4-epimerase GalE [Polaromonas sp. A23]|uniref:UDP-glucose 4-epimerase GalE n=1 Tax=Polaromonas sp. A23 TaxID=1944133 RepID=UPI000985F21C|nr:UDP-glucose 4-epimerase GalE [Polaromonas sp. A23]OOG47605.1 UDP-glucose 4-epimerase GalE [Polaromonas sp. A23]